MLLCLSNDAQAILHAVAGYTDMNGATFVQPANIERLAGIEAGEVGQVLAELENAGEIAQLTRRGSGYMFRVVQENRV